MRRLLRAALALALVPALSFAQAPKQKITRAADLPKFQYSIHGTLEDLVKSDEAFRPFAAELRKNVESVLRDYDIEDKSATRSLLNVLVSLDLLEGKDASARQRLAQMKELEEKPSARALSGLIPNAILDARSQVPDRQSPAYRHAVYTAIKRSLDSLPYDLVQNDVKRQKASAEITTEALLIGEIQSEFDPVVRKTGGLSSDLADSLPGMRLTLTEVLPLKDTIAEVIGAYVSANAKEKKDIWAARDVVLAPGKNYRPVNVAVWDSGVDLTIFKDRVARDTAGNPAVLAYDIESRRSSGNLFPLSPEQQRRFPSAEKELKGLSDLQANIDSPEAAAFRQAIAKLKPAEVRPFLEEIQLFGTYAHGTHVAGIFTAGNPYARLVTGRITFDWKLIPDPCPSLALTERDAAAYQDYVDFFRKNNVRVVNMSWGGSVQEYEDGMEKCGIGKNIEERKATAREWFQIEKTALEKALNSAPEILFVAAAGNSNGNANFEEFIPSSLRVANLLTVGAVDQAGDEASFTSYGPTVAVHANGFQVESYVPGGDRLKMSGTSMASPNVANLAAKILTVKPSLKPAQVIDLIRRTAEKTPDGRRNLIDPKKAVAAALQ